MLGDMQDKREKLGNIIYRTVSIITAMFIVWFKHFVKTADISQESIMFIAAGVVLFWLIGWAARYFLTGNASVRFY
jgi:uncharacterized membrane protein